MDPEQERSKRTCSKSKSVNKSSCPNPEGKEDAGLEQGLGQIIFKKTVMRERIIKLGDFLSSGL